MKPLSLILWLALLLLAFLLPASAQISLTGTASLSGTVHLSVTPASGVSFSDDFNRADAATLGANWTVLAGNGMSVSNNQAIATEYDSQYDKNAAVYNTNTATVSQYAKVTINGGEAAGNGIYPQILLRVNGTNECYSIEIKPNENLIELQYYTNAAGSATVIASASTAIATNDTFAVTVSGTGNSTVWRVWINPTGLPTAADNWDGDTTPTATFTDDPAVAADTGLGVGLAVYVQLNVYCKLDDFFGGDIP